MSKVYIINIECRLDIDDTMFSTLKRGFTSFEQAKDYVLNTLIPNEKKTSWIHNYPESELEFSQNIEENYLWWECQYNDYDKYTSITIEEILF